MSFSPSGSHLLTAGNDKTLKVYASDGSTSVCRFKRTFAGHSNWVRSAAWSPNSNTLLSGSDDSTVRTWDAAQGVCTGTLYDHMSAVLSVAFSPDGRTFAAGGRDGSMKVWDSRAPANALLLHFSGHSSSESSSLVAGAAGVSSLAWHPDGNSLLSTGASDGTFKVWDLREGRLLYTVHAHKSGAVNGACFSPGDGNLFATAGGDDAVHIWKTNFSPAPSLPFATSEKEGNNVSDSASSPIRSVSAAVKEHAAVPITLKRSPLLPPPLEPRNTDSSVASDFKRIESGGGVRRNPQISFQAPPTLPPPPVPSAAQEQGPSVNSTQTLALLLQTALGGITAQMERMNSSIETLTDRVSRAERGVEKLAGKKYEAT